MLKDKNRKVVKVGDWISDTDGVYEVVKVDNHEAEVVEVVFATESEYLVTEDTYIKLKSEVALMEIIV